MDYSTGRLRKGDNILKKILIVTMVLLCGNTAFARKEYYSAFQNSPSAKYISSMAIKIRKCNICHVGRNKTQRNDYGKLLDTIIESKTKDIGKIKEALYKVEQMKSPSGATYAEIFHDGELPK